MVTMSRQYLPGSLVRARGRDWVVVPADEEDVVRLRPVDGSDDDAIGLFLPIEDEALEQSQYPPPDPGKAGSLRGGLLLRDAVRLMLRSGAGPFRSLGRLSVVPRPYQYVPLIMALRQDPVRLLIADDVGVGKTIEAGMIARELLDRGLAKRLAVICPPHLCDQWHEELQEKFNIETAVVQPSRIARLERGVPRRDISLYQYYRHLVVSIDYIKSERNRDRFLNAAPDLIIVDEAHTASRTRGGKNVRQQQRFEFLKQLARDPSRHFIMTTATPHSGIEGSFRSILGLLDESFDTDPDQRLDRKKLTPHVIQRRRRDIVNWLGADTHFPDRVTADREYQLSPEYSSLFEDIVTYCRETVAATAGAGTYRKRVRFWAAVSILRSALSSPRAAEAMLEKRRARKRGTEDVDSPSDEAFASQILDSSDSEETPDYIPTAAFDDAGFSDSEIRRLDGFLKRAQGLSGPEKDGKVRAAAEEVDRLLGEGYSPIVFCRFIDTARYVAEQLQAILGNKHRGLVARSVTGDDGGDQERKVLVGELSEESVRVLVATDCLSEGVNLQEHFNAVVHYDLPWNPNRLEQREGRVDRFGQERETVRAVTLIGTNNVMDRMVMDVLVRKARNIRSTLGISVPVPVPPDQVVQSLIDSVLFSSSAGGQQLGLGISTPEIDEMNEEWDAAAKRDDEERAYFSQQGIDPDEVAGELREMEQVLGNSEDLRQFTANAVQLFNGSLNDTKKPAVYSLVPGDLAESLARRMGATDFPLSVTFDGMPREGALHVGRNHPAATVVAEAVLADALRGGPPELSRSAAVFTTSVSTRTAVLVLRIRYLLKEKNVQQFAEEVVIAAFQGDGDGIRWLGSLDTHGLELLREAAPIGVMSPQERAGHVQWALNTIDGGGDWYADIVEERAVALTQFHDRLRKVVSAGKLSVRPHTPPDIIGCYVLVPGGGS